MYLPFFFLFYDIFWDSFFYGDCSCYLFSRLHLFPIVFLPSASLLLFRTVSIFLLSFSEITDFQLGLVALFYTPCSPIPNFSLLPRSLVSIHSKSTKPAKSCLNFNNFPNWHYVLCIQILLNFLQLNFIFRIIRSTLHPRSTHLSSKLLTVPPMYFKLDQIPNIRTIKLSIAAKFLSLGTRTSGLAC